MSERTIQLRGVHAYESRYEAIANEPSRELRGVETPDREEGFKSCGREQALAIGPDVRQKEITERD
jgi:hypothetical protein